MLSCSHSAFNHSAISPFGQMANWLYSRRLREVLLPFGLFTQTLIRSLESEKVGRESLGELWLIYYLLVPSSQLLLTVTASLGRAGSPVEPGKLFDLVFASQLTIK